MVFRAMFRVVPEGNCPLQVHLYSIHHPFRFLPTAGVCNQQLGASQRLLPTAGAFDQQLSGSLAIAPQAPTQRQTSAFREKGAQKLQIRVDQKGPNFKTQGELRFGLKYSAMALQTVNTKGFSWAEGPKASLGQALG